VRLVAGDVTSAADVAAAAVGHDAAIHAAAVYGAGTDPDGFFPGAARALIEGLRQAGTAASAGTATSPAAAASAGTATSPEAAASAGTATSPAAAVTSRDSRIGWIRRIGRDRQARRGRSSRAATRSRRHKAARRARFPRRRPLILPGPRRRLGHSAPRRRRPGLGVRQPGR
jgi:hypothetical protein